MHHMTAMQNQSTHIHNRPHYKLMVPSGAPSSSLPLAIVLSCFLSSFLLPAFSRDVTPVHNDLQTLLCLKNHLSDSSGMLDSWKNDSLQHCIWAGVGCSKRHTSRVVALDLRSFCLNGQIPLCIANLTFLERIDFANNQLGGPIPSELGQLNRLQYLNLSSNNLTGVIPNTLPACSRLQIIDLGRNQLQGEIPSNLSQCINLSKLILQRNSLSGGIPEGLGKLHNLLALRLADNSLTGSIPWLLANSSSLQMLDLTNNYFGGVIPYALLNSRSLKTIGLGGNNFVGSIPVFSLTDSPLQYLILSSNNLSGTIPSSLGNFSSLCWLLLAENQFQGSIPISISQIPNLQALDLTSNFLSGNVPISIYNMSKLTYLGLGNNNLVGAIPDSIGHTLASIETLILQQNQFHGEIPASLANTTNLMTINLQYNALSGTVPSLGTLPNLMELNLDMNQLEAGDWSFLTSLANCTQLIKISLSSNKIQGPLPSSIGNLSKSLQLLLLTSNSISGTIPPEIGYLTNLRILYMEKNLFTGGLPDTIGNLSRLFGLSLSHNKLSRQIPLSISNLSQMNELYLQENNFSGPIPAALGYCKNLEAMNLSCNSFDGDIPKQLFSLSSLSEFLDLSHNQLSGQIPLEINGLLNLGLLNISNNQLSGEIPSTLGQCVHLECLRMEGNLVDGRIPESFAELRGLTVLDLSRNNLSGEIPKIFSSSTSLSLLNLSFNNLEGQVPIGGIFENGSAVFIQGNRKLCGSTPLIQLPLCQAESFRRKHISNILEILGFSALSLVPLSCLVFILLRRKKHKSGDDLSCKELIKVSYADLVEATNDFSQGNLVGSGKFGLVYKGRVEFEEQAVAIKVFRPSQLGAPESFLTECEVLRNTRHRNLVKVITACSSLDSAGNEFRALVLEYMTNGSLETWLHPKPNNYGFNRPLSLAIRIIIAVDIASALDYLHNLCGSPIVHCDLKPSNVLLGNAMVAHIGDFGLSKFLHDHSNGSSSVNSSTSLLKPRGSIGYIAPEYGFGGKISREGDVYSFGIIILELLTGKRPTDDMFCDGWSLHKYVVDSVPQNICDILDPNVIPNVEDEDVIPGIMSCIMQLVRLGLSCSANAPKDRPTMQDVCAEVIAIKEEFSALHS